MTLLVNATRAKSEAERGTPSPGAESGKRPRLISDATDPQQTSGVERVEADEFDGFLA